MNNTLSIVYYIVFAFICSILLHIISKQKKNKSLFDIRAFVISKSGLVKLVLIVYIVLFCAFREIGRNAGGTDAYVYMLQFNSSTGSLLDQFVRFRGWETLHAFSLWIIRQLTDEYRTYLIFYYIFMSLFLIKYAKMFNLNKRWFLATFTLMLTFLNSFNIQRNIFATFASIYIIDALLKKKYKYAFIYTIIISGFHYSALIYLIVSMAAVFIKTFKGDFKIKLFAYIASSSVLSYYICGFFPSIVVGSRLGIYSSGESSISISMLLAFGIIMCIFLCYYREILNIGKYDDLIILSALYLAFAPMFIFQLQYPIMYRFMLYSMPVLYILLSRYKDFFILKRGSKILLYVLCDLMLIFKIFSFVFDEVDDIGLYSNMMFP